MDTAMRQKVVIWQGEEDEYYSVINIALLLKVLVSWYLREFISFTGESIMKSLMNTS
jgi:hypothetical protein